jgi:hypothetical protein
MIRGLWKDLLENLFVILIVGIIIIFLSGIWALLVMCVYNLVASFFNLPLMNFWGSLGLCFIFLFVCGMKINVNYEKKGE